jgi:hypothetical protein
VLEGSDVKLERLEIYLGHAIDLNDFGGKLYYLGYKIRVFVLRDKGPYGPP